MKTLLATVIFPVVESYLDDWLRSVERQTDPDFDLLVLNDGCAPEVERRFPAGRTHWLREGSPWHSTNRQSLVRWACQRGYEALVFADADDFFDDDRVERAKLALRGTDFVFNELHVVDEQGRMLRPNLLAQWVESPRLSSPEPLLRHNWVGLSHTAIRLEGLGALAFPEDFVNVDWWLFSHLLLMGRAGQFEPRTATHYRQGPGNFVGAGQPLDEARLALGLRVKRQHYTHMERSAAGLALPGWRARYAGLLARVGELARALERPGFRAAYLDGVNRALPRLFRGWWSDLPLLDDWAALELGPSPLTFR